MYFFLFSYYMLSKKFSMLYDDDKLWYFNQTPISLCKDIISNIEWKQGEVVLEPFAGTNNFYDNLPEEVIKHRCEIRDNKDFRNFDYNGVKPETIITNPPFDLGESNRIRKNDFFKILEFFTKIKSIKRIIFLASSTCFESLTPKRLQTINENGFFIQKITIINIKKWRGRYYLIELNRTYNPSFDYYMGIYE